MAVPFRIVPVSPAESELSGTARPQGFTGTGDRPGKANSFSWWVVFYDTDGNVMTGGVAVVQWYGVAFDGDTITTPTIGAQLQTDALILRTISVAAGIWPWCRVLGLDGPAVPVKKIQVTVGGTGDGVWSVQVDATTAVTFVASGNTGAEIRDGLLAAFAGHPTATATAVGGDPLRFNVAHMTGGVDFALTLISPGDRLSQAVLIPVTPAAGTMRIYLSETIAAGVDTDALSTQIVEATATAVTAAVVAAVPGASDIYGIASAAVQDGLSDANLSYNLLSDASLAAAETAIDNKAAVQTIPSAAVVATEVHGTRSMYGGSFGDGGTENDVAAVNASSHIEVLGWMATAGATQLTIELRSGPAGGANSSLTGSPAKGSVGAGSAINLTPSDTALWRTADGQGLMLKRSVAAVAVQITVWYRVVPN